MTSVRAEGVAEALWELKRAGKVATFSSIAERAGFSAGSNGRTVRTAMKVVRRDWDHLQWWRALSDDLTVKKDSEHAEKLAESGYEVVEADGKEDVVTLADLEEHLMSWEDDESQKPDAEAAE